MGHIVQEVFCTDLFDLWLSIQVSSSGHVGKLHPFMAHMPNVVVRLSLVRNILIFPNY